MTESMANDRRRVAGPVVVGLSFVVLGLPDYAHGVAWPAMRGDLHRPLADLGTFLAVQSVGYVLATSLLGRITGRWGLDRAIRGAGLSCVAGLALVAVAPGWLVVLAGSLFLGLGSGVMDAGFNAAVALRNDARLMGVLHAGYGVGAGVGPVVVGATLAAGSGWRPAYVVLAVVTLVVVASLTGRTIGSTPVAPHHAPSSPRGVLLPCLAFFVYVALEVTVGAWAFTYLTGPRGLGDLAASAWVAVYWVGLTGGRLWLGVRGHEQEVDRLLLLGMLGATAAALVLWLGGPVAPLGLLLAGTSLSVVFPLLMLVTPARVGVERAAAAVGWQAAAGSVGSAAGPAAAGLVLDVAGVDAYGPVVLVMAVALAATVGALRR
ncbi:MAG: Permease of the major facilitator superfamily [Actinomycetia bacterium]|nr:Permease of the major facilitator superfamily [Actinomycetes bacterium]